MKTKKNRRNQTKYPALKKNLNVKVRQELIDYDYIDKLSPTDKQWLNKFTEEYTNGSFTKNEDRSKYVGNLHKTKKLRNECWNRNNWRNNDVFSKTKSTNMLKDAKSAQAVIEDRSIRSASLSRGYDNRTFRS